MSGALRRAAGAALRCSAVPSAPARAFASDAASEARLAYQHEVSARRRQWAVEQEAARAARAAARQSRIQAAAAERAVRKAAQAEVARIRRLELDELEAQAAAEQAEIAAFRLQRLQLRGEVLDAAKEERRAKLDAQSANWVHRSALDARINAVLDASPTMPPWL